VYDPFLLSLSPVCLEDVSEHASLKYVLRSNATALYSVIRNGHIVLPSVF